MRAVAVEGAWLAPLDRARTALFVRALRVAPLRAVLLEKRRRIPSLLLCHAFAALVLSVLAPTLLLVVGPLVLGVPHLVADVRYLVLRPELERRTRALLIGGSAVLFVLGAAGFAGVRGLSRWEFGFLAAWIAAGALVLAPRLLDRRLVIVVCGASALGAFGWLAPATLRLVLAHAHNLVALVIWARLFCPSRTRAACVALVITAVGALLAFTPLAFWGFEHGISRSFGLNTLAASDALAPFARSAPLAIGIVASFAFLQSVHYGVWVHAIPQEATPGEGTLTFRMSYRALLAELGGAGLALAVLISLGVTLRGIFAPLSTQAAYLSLSVFHGYLELAALALFWLRPSAAHAHRLEATGPAA